jgi:formate-dependent nitrite reductase cytochrome c552 subunit
MCLSRLTVVFFFLSMVLPQTVFAVAEYVGSEQCSGCHMDLYSNWHASGHHQQLRKAEKAQHANLALPPGYSWGDISYVIGGVNKKALFVDQDGYLITSAKNGSKAKTQYNLEDDSWSYYLPGQKKPYDCAYCHTTGYSPEGHQNGLAGIVGTWEEDGVGCESCHGPGGDHAKTPVIKTSRLELTAEICEKCHQRGGIDHKPLVGSGLIRHHEQINELKSGAHKGLSCLNCHNPHRRAIYARDNCTICHSRLYNDFKDSIHGKAELKCFECHMPRVSQSAISRTSYMGEVRTHLFKINTDPKANMFMTIDENDKKSTFTKGFVTVDFVCLGCHGSRHKAWAVMNAKGFHK